MDVRLHDDLAGFAALAGPLYDADPVRHTIAHTAFDAVRHGAATPALLLTVYRRGEVTGAALRVVGRPLLVSALPPAVATAADAAAAADPDLDAATGPVTEVEAFAAAHAARTGSAVHVAMRQRLFRLLTLCPPRGVAGSARPAETGDVDLLTRWYGAFAAEAVRELAAVPENPRLEVADAVRRGGVLLWEADGSPVAFAVARPPVAGMSRIGPVYTPRGHRGRGYGSAVTAATAAWARQAGARDVVLFTNLANPVSNAIYPRIGFHPVLDALEVAFR
ncbi:GNAT family N-acetyltransferase [Pseudonocardia asaccharolytica]|uniref:GNAT family N-acetyltransferase n=1 Tax=Pseudonocardia asaccharolytica TaxID=54010 RepID=UPI00042504A6|nr:GNAT family N-acetyltransferase [Pseudonocardia asaccharolytica]